MAKTQLDLRLIPGSFSTQADLSQVERNIDDDVAEFKEVRHNSIGYPRCSISIPWVEKQLAKVLPFGVHNVGDWRTGSQFQPNAFHVEVELMKFLVQLWECPGGLENFWGYVDDSGTSGNLWGVKVGTEVLAKRCPKLGSPVLVISEAAHYSFDNAVGFTKIQCEKVQTKSDDTINIAAFKEVIAKYPDRPILIGIMNGTTVKEARDDITAIFDAVKATGRPREHFYIHADAAYSGLYVPLLKKAPDNIKISFTKHDLDSVSTSTHKFIGTARTGGMYMTHLKHSEVAATTVEYIRASSKTMGGSRDAFPMYETLLRLYYVGMDRMTEWAEAIVQKAMEVKEDMKEAGVQNVELHDFATTVYFKQPSEALMKKHCLAPHGENCHLIVEPHTLNELGEFEVYGSVDSFMEDFLKELRAA